MLELDYLSMLKKNTELRMVLSETTVQGRINETTGFGFNHPTNDTSLFGSFVPRRTGSAAATRAVF